MGGIRLSYDDFCRLTPDEFDHIYKEYRAFQDSAYKEEWERARMLATIIIQPHLKKRISPRGLLPFPWENPEKKGGQGEPLNAEESKKRFEEIARRL